MDQEELSLLLLLGYVVTDEDLWKGDEDGLEPPPAKGKRLWVREWIKRRNWTTSNTMYKLQCEISEVSPVKKHEFDCSYE